MRLGIIAYSSSTGLGHQTRELYRHMKPAKTLVIDLQAFNGMAVHHEWFPDARICHGYMTAEDIDWLTDDVDAIFVCETPLNFDLYRIARQKGVKTIQQYNFEFLDYFEHPDWPRPDVLAAPTSWRTDDVRLLMNQIDPATRILPWPVPVNREEVPFRVIEQCKTFVHIIGRPSVHDRNGTLSFLEAARKIGRRAKYKIYVQPPTDQRAIEYFEPVRLALQQYQEELDLSVIHSVERYQDMYAEGDVLVLPRRYGGLCLPMNEALSAGMPVIMTDISPNQDQLIDDWLVPAYRLKNFKPRPIVDVYEADVNQLAFKMLQFFNESGYMYTANGIADDLAKEMSWETLKPHYDELLEQVCAQ